MKADDLRARLARLDPTVDASWEPIPTSLLEHTMTTTLDTPKPASSPARRRPLTVLAAAAAALAVAGAAVFLTQDTSAPRERTSLALQLAGGLSMSSCVPFDTAALAQMPLAFAGTVTAVDGGEVRLDVTRWYTGGDADEATLAVPDAQSSAALDGVEFTAGGRYLIAATNGTVNGCGFSGPVSPELQAAYDEAF